jgi:hypothetical protein
MNRLRRNSYHSARTIYRFLRKRAVLINCFTSFLLISLYLVNFAYAQQASSECVVTKVGAPLTSPTLPAGCNALAGNYRFPLESVDIVTGIFTEMGSYAGNFSYSGHTEHAGLDIGTPDDQRGPVYAITEGEVVELGGDSGTCQAKDDGCSVSIKHSTDKFISRYTHIDPAVAMGDTVRKGDKIGNVHQWITYNNDHLHFELHQQENNYNINPRNYFPELQRFPAVADYFGGVRAHSASRGIHLLDDGKEWAEMFRDHPPCSYADCWAL